MFDRNFHFLSRTEGENYARLMRFLSHGQKTIETGQKQKILFKPTIWFHFFLKLRTVRTHTSLFGGRGPCRCLEGSGAFRRRHSKRANKTTPTRRLAQSVQHWFHLGTPSSFPMFLEAQVRRATVTSSRRRAGVFNEGRAASLEKSTSTRVLQSLPGVKLWLASSQNWKKNSRASSRRGLWHGGGQHLALPARTSGQRRCHRLMWTRGVGQRCSSACTHIRLEWFNFLSFFFFFFWSLPKTFILNSWSMPF